MEPARGPAIEERAEGISQDQQTALLKKDAEIADLKQQLHVALENWSKWEHRAHDVEQSTQRQIQDLKRQLNLTTQRLDDKSKMLGDRIEELASAQAFVTTADQCSTAEVSSMVEQLNEDIYQCAAFMVDAIFDVRNSRRPVDGQMEAAFAKAQKEARSAMVERWDENLVNRLEADLSSEENVLVECLIQSMLVKWCYEITSPFFHESRRTRRTLTQVWKGIGSLKGPAVANNWRAMTFSQLKTKEVDTKPTADKIDSFMIFCGWRHQAEAGNLPTKVNEKLRELAQKARKIKEMAFEGILSTDVRTFYPSVEDRYDPSTMQDGHDTGKVEAGGRIICSTGLGVEAVAKRRDPSTQEKTRRLVALKSSVLLASTLGSK
ncbi:hypothetical protein H1R20_g14839, partial [Candolleomyces eurysporus]